MAIFMLLQSQGLDKKQEGDPLPAVFQFQAICFVENYSDRKNMPRKIPPVHLRSEAVQFQDLLTTMNPDYLPRVLSWGAGYDSTALLLEYCLNPESRDFPLENLIVVHAVVGSEARQLQQQIETHLFPLLRELGVWVVQANRNSDFERDGITILDSTREPFRFYRRGTYRLYDHLLRNGVVPQRGGKGRLCTIKFKSWVIDTIARSLFGDSPRLRFIGYNNDERKRSEKECWQEEVKAEYLVGYNADELGRLKDRSFGQQPYIYEIGFNASEPGRARAESPHWRGQVFRFPLIEMGLDRQWCEERVRQFAGTWRKSYCIDCCPFPECSGKRRSTGDHGDLRQDWAEEPYMGARSAMVETIAMAMNERQPLFEKMRVIDILQETENWEAIELFEEMLRETDWAVYEVRRIFVAASPGKKPPAPYRKTTILFQGDRDAACQELGRLADRKGLQTSILWDTPRAIVIARPEGKNPPRPYVEKFLVACPATVIEKKRVSDQEYERLWKIATYQATEENHEHIKRTTRRVSRISGESRETV